jgi:hypothetical protein
MLTGAIIAASAVIGSAQTVIQVTFPAPPDSLAGYVQRSNAIVLGQVTNSVQKRGGGPVPNVGNLPPVDIPVPYIDHEVKILKVIKDDGIVGKHQTIQVRQSGGVVVSQGVTYSVEPTEKPFNIHEKLILFLIAKDAGAASYVVGPYGAFHVSKAVDKSDVVQIPRHLPEFKGEPATALDEAISKLRSAVKAGRGRQQAQQRDQPGSLRLFEQ